MEQRKWISAYFSPTGTTAAVTRAVASGADVQAAEWDLTIPGKFLDVEANSVLLAAVPVYGGRIPVPAAKCLSQLNGENNYAVALAVYGNRDFDESLLELKDILERQGFQVVAAGAFIAEHSIIRSIAAGRPDKNDLAIASQFGADIAKLLSGTKCFSPIVVPGNEPYRGGGSSSVHPTAGDQCTGVDCVRKTVQWKQFPLKIRISQIQTNVLLVCAALPSARRMPGHFLHNF